MADKNKTGDWIDPRGHTVPSRYVKAFDRKKDQTVERIFRLLEKLQHQIATAKGKIIHDFNEFLEYTEQQADVKIGGDKGNATLSNFSSTRKIERSNQDYIDFDNRINLVKTIIDECIQKWSKEITTPIKPIVDKVFEVDSKGRLNIKGLKSLKQLKINDQEWNKAMKLLDEAENVISTKTFFRAYKRDNTESAYRYINLDFGDIEPIMPKIKKGKNEN